MKINMSSSTPTRSSYLPLLDPSGTISGRITKNISGRKLAPQPAMQSRYEITALKASHEAYISSLTASFEAEIASLKAENDTALQACQDAGVAELERLRAEHARAVEQLKVGHDMEIQSFQIQLDQLQTDADAKLKQMGAENAATIARLEDGRSAELESLKKQSESYGAELRALRSKHEVELENRETTLKDAIAEAARNTTLTQVTYESNMDKLKANVKSLEKQLKQERTTGSGRFIELHYKPFQDFRTRSYITRTFVFKRTDIVADAMSAFENSTNKDAARFKFTFNGATIEQSEMSKSLAEIGVNDGDVFNFRFVA